MNELVRQELEIIRTENGGFLRPADVVNYARSEDTALHEMFEWDNTKAAERYRLAQARSVIRVCVIVNENTSEKIRAFVSLSSDRQAKNGYRAMAEVIDDEILKETMLNDALRDLQAFQRKYDDLRRNAQIGVVLQTIDNVLTASETESRATA